MLRFCFWGERIFLSVGYQVFLVAYLSSALPKSISGGCKSRVSLEPSWLELEKKTQTNKKTLKHPPPPPNKTEGGSCVYFSSSILVHQDHFCKLISVMPFLPFTLHRKISKSCQTFIPTYTHTCVSSATDCSVLKIRNSSTEQLHPWLAISKNKGEEGADGQRNTLLAFSISHLQGGLVYWSTPNKSQGYSG